MLNIVDFRDQTFTVHLALCWGAFVKQLLQCESNNITYCVCTFVTLFIPCAKRMRHIFMSSVACLSLLQFSTWSQKTARFSEKLLNAKCLFWFSLQRLSETFLSPSKIKRDIIMHGILLVFLRNFNKIWIFLIDVRKNTQI